MPQGTFRTQFVQQALRVPKDFLAELGITEQTTPTTCDFLFGKQPAPLIMVKTLVNYWVSRANMPD
jgi:hypothetical protein